MRRSRLSAALLLGALAFVPAGCATVASLNSAAQTLPTYTLNPLAPQPGAARSGTRVLYVADPSAPGALGSDRIVLKPSPIEITLVPDGRWAEAAPIHLRNVLARSLANTGRFAFVTTGNTGPLPDFTVMTDIDHFEAQLLPEGAGAPAQVTVSLTLSVVRDADSRLVASRRFTRTAQAPDIDARDVVAAFEAANNALLRDAVPWATSVMTGRPGV